MGLLARALAQHAADGLVQGVVASDVLGEGQDVAVQVADGGEVGGAGAAEDVLHGFHGGCQAPDVRGVDGYAVGDGRDVGMYLGQAFLAAQAAAGAGEVLAALAEHGLAAGAATTQAHEDVV